MDWFEYFSEKGYAKIPAIDITALSEIRQFIAEQINLSFNLNSQEKDVERFLDQFHTYGISDVELNAGKLKLIDKCNQKGDIGKLVYQAFSTYIDRLLGPDLLVQKSTNIILFPPHYQHYSEPHRDAPLNSPFELVFWIPLTRCYKSKSMYVLNIKDSAAAFDLLVDKASFNEFENFCASNGEYFEAQFGEGCIFWPGLAHGSIVNVEEGTRWTLNIRFKNVYSPNGEKDSLQFFEIFHLSPITKMGMQLEKSSLL